MKEKSYITFNQKAIEQDLQEPETILIIDPEQTMTVERMMELLNNSMNSKPLESKIAKILNDKFLDLF